MLCYDKDYHTKILDKISADFFTFQHNFPSTKVKWNYFITTRKQLYELLNLLNDLRLTILEN